MQQFLAVACEHHRQYVQQHQALPPAFVPPQWSSSTMAAVDVNPSASAPTPPLDVHAAARGTVEYHMLEAALEKAKGEGREAEFWLSLHAQISERPIPVPVSEAPVTAPPAPALSAAPFAGLCAPSAPKYIPADVTMLAQPQQHMSLQPPPLPAPALQPTPSSQASQRPALAAWGIHGFCHLHLLPSPSDDGKCVGRYTRQERRERIHRRVCACRYP